MAKRVELDPNSAKSLFKRTEPAVSKSLSVPKEQKEKKPLPITKNPEPASSQKPKPRRASQKPSAKSVPVPQAPRYDLVRLMAVGGKYIYLTQITDAEPILSLLTEFEKEYGGKYLSQTSESPLGIIGYIALSEFVLPLTSGDTFRWFAAKLCHNGWKPFAAEQSSPDIPANQYRDAIYFRLDHMKTRGNS